MNILADENIKKYRRFKDHMLKIFVNTEEYFQTGKNKADFLYDRNVDPYELPFANIYVSDFPLYNYKHLQNILDAFIEIITLDILTDNDYREIINSNYLRGVDDSIEGLDGITLNDFLCAISFETEGFVPIDNRIEILDNLIRKNCIAYDTLNQTINDLQFNLPNDNEILKSNLELIIKKFQTHIINFDRVIKDIVLKILYL